MTKIWRPGKEEWERIKTAAHNRILKERGLPLSDDDYIEVGADAMLEILRYYPAGPLLCKFPGCQEQSLIYCYCQEHYRQLNRVT